MDVAWFCLLVSLKPSSPSDLIKERNIYKISDSGGKHFNWTTLHDLGEIGSLQFVAFTSFESPSHFCHIYLPNFFVWSWQLFIYFNYNAARKCYPHTCVSKDVCWLPHIVGRQKKNKMYLNHKLEENKIKRNEIYVNVHIMKNSLRYILN